MSDLNEQVSVVLRYVLSLPVNVSDGNFREAKATRRYEAHHSKEGVMAYLGSVLGWLPLNPSDEGIREAIRETYVHLEYERDGGRTIPESAAFRHLYDDIINDSVKCIFVTGD